MLKDDDPLLSNDAQPQVIDIETENFSLYERDNPVIKHAAHFNCSW